MNLGYPLAIVIVLLGCWDFGYLLLPVGQQVERTVYGALSVVTLCLVGIAISAGVVTLVGELNKTMNLGYPLAIVFVLLALCVFYLVGAWMTKDVCIAETWLGRQIENLVIGFLVSGLFCGVALGLLAIVVLLAEKLR